ncbi:MAG: hypothetical protein ACYTBJ_23055 [Planctomycetota bacterium]
MPVLQKILALVCCVFLLGGCYEEELEITLNADGSGTVKEKLLISERLIVATSEDGGDKNTPPVSKEEVLEKVGSAVDITSITLTELPDGGRIIEFEGTFSSAEQFFLSDFCRHTLKLRLAPAGDRKAAIYCDAWQSSGDVSGPSTTQLYGLVKGLYVKRTVHLPAEIEKTNGYRGKDKNTVSWVTDLRNKQGLARTKAFVEGEDKGVGSVVFDASALGFSLPLKAAAPTNEIAESENKSSSQEPSELKAEVSWVAINKKVALDSNSNEPAISDLEFGIKVNWTKDTTPFACHTPVLTNIQDDLGNDLVKSTYESVHKINGPSTEKVLKTKTEAPNPNAKIIRNLEGYVSVVTNVNRETVILENMHELAGKETTANPVLDKLHFKIKSIQGPRLNIEIDGGHNTITSLEVFAKDASKVKRRGGGGWGNTYSYDFDNDISKLNKCELEVVVSQTIVKVPFSLEKVVLP